MVFRSRKICWRRNTESSGRATTWTRSLKIWSTWSFKIRSMWFIWRYDQHGRLRYDPVGLFEAVQEFHKNIHSWYISFEYFYGILGYISWIYIYQPWSTSPASNVNKRTSVETISLFACWTLLVEKVSADGKITFHDW